jgi:ribose transport system substrate-binding protein
VSRRSAGIILAPNHPLALMTTVRKAVLLGIPTVVISSPLPLAASNRLFYVLNDEEEEGKIAARRIGLRLNGKGSVAILGLNSDNNDLLSRMRSFETTLTLEFPHIMIHSRHLESSSEAQAEQIAHGLLAGERIPDAIVALTATATTGAVRAIEDDSLRKRIVLVSCDQNYESLYSLSLGKVDSIVAENTFAMGYQAAQLILAAKSGSLETGTYYVKPVLVTRDNMYSPQLFHILTYDTRALY